MFGILIMELRLKEKSLSSPRATRHPAVGQSPKWAAESQKKNWEVEQNELEIYGKYLHHLRFAEKIVNTKELEKKY